ncbi:MAG: hydroxyacid dehydrogenase [Candidatus Omnitrophota bacterium]
MNIAVFEVAEWERQTFERLEDEHDIQSAADPLLPDNAGEYRDAEIISAFIYSKLSRGTLEKLPNLKLIATRSTGFDHIDQDFCNEKNIAICNVPSYGENTVAEHVFALLLMISHRLKEAVDRTRRGDFSFEGLRGFDLKGRTLGIIGTGHIGECTARIAKGFGMSILAMDLKPREDLAEELGFDYVDMDTLLAKSDVVTIHVPAKADTKCMFTKEQFAKMKDSAVLINTARGNLVDNEALMDALSSGKLKAAGLDVLPEEPMIREEAELLRPSKLQKQKMEDLLADHLLLRMNNVVITPHNAFNTKEAVERILSTTFKNITGFIKGDPLNVVNDAELQHMAKG